MKTILLEIGDSVKLYNGTEGNIIAFDVEKYEVMISSLNSYPQAFHIRNIRELNGIEVDSDYLIL